MYIVKCKAVLIMINRGLSRMWRWNGIDGIARRDGANGEAESYVSTTWTDMYIRSVSFTFGALFNYQLCDGGGQREASDLFRDLCRTLV